MDDLEQIFKCFELKSRVFQAGPLCQSSEYDTAAGLGYIHVLKTGVLDIKSPSHPALRIEEPCLFFYLNPTEHRLEPVGTDVTIFCASFEFGLGLQTPLAKALPDIVMLRLEDIVSLNRTLELLFNEAEQTQNGRQAILDRLMEVVILQIIRDLIAQKRITFGLLAALAEPRLAKALNVMHNQPAEAWSLEQLASLSGMSRASFAVKFRETVGITPMNYLTEWRINLAQSLLVRGKSLQLASDTVGYSNTSAFSRAFKAQTGSSPMEWLKIKSP